MTERGLPIVDGAPACPFVAFADDRDERATSPDHRHRCYAETKPAPRALAHQEAYCLSSAFPVCPTFQDWARREAARAREDAARTADARSAADAAAGQGRNPPRNWAAPPPWLSRRGRQADEGQGSLWAGEEPSSDPMAPFEAPGEPVVPRRGLGLSGSYADLVASDRAAAPGAEDDDADEQAVGAGPSAGPSPSRQTPPPVIARVEPPAAARVEAPAPVYHAPETWDDELAEGTSEPPQRAIRRRERDLVRPDRTGRPEQPDAKRPGVAPAWERAKPLEAYPTIRSRRLTELSIPPILLAVVALALAMAVVFALPGLLGFGSPGGGAPGAAGSPTLPVRTAIPSVNPTPVPQPTAQIYIVQAGDTMSRIAGRFGVALQDLINANKDTVPKPDNLQIGQEVIIPPKTPTDLPAATVIPGAT